MERFLGRLPRRELLGALLGVEDLLGDCLCCVVGQLVVSRWRRYGDFVVSSRRRWRDDAAKHRVSAAVVGAEVHMPHALGHVDGGCIERLGL